MRLNAENLTYLQYETSSTLFSKLSIFLWGYIVQYNRCIPLLDFVRMKKCSFVQVIGLSKV
jgi:hypothetical protein